MASALAKKLFAEAKLRRTRQVGQGIDPSRKIELTYRNELIKLINEMIEASSIEAISSNLFPGDGSIPVGDVTPEDQLSETLGRIEALRQKFATVSVPLSRKIVSAADEIHRKAFVSTIKRTIGVDVKQVVAQENLSAVLQRSIDDNVNLIRSIHEKYLNKVNQAIQDSLINGTKQSLQDKLQEIAGSTKDRAKLIARDQAAKFNASLTEARQTNLGIEEYVWVTSHDDRVRESHAANDGKTFKWSDPPETGHPGEDILCRCIARPVFKRKV